MKAQTKNVWAPIVKPKRGREWVLYHAISTTKKGSIDLLLEGIPEHLHARQLERVRFAKVTITEQQP